MAAAIAFNQGLIRCGFNQDTATAIIGQGFDSLAIVAAADDKNIDGMIKSDKEVQGHAILGERAGAMQPTAQYRALYGASHRRVPHSL